MEEQLRRIGDLIQSSSEGSFWTDILATMPATVIAAIAAIAAAWATIYFQNRSLSGNAYQAIMLEIEALVGEIDRVLQIGGPNEVIPCNVIAMGASVTPIYSSNSQYISLIDRAEARLIITFYRNFFSIPRTSDTKFSKQDIRTLVEIGHKALERTRNVRQYPK